MTPVLAVRLDNEGDVLLAGPAIRALAAGARAVLVPTPVTRPEEVEATAAVVGSLPEAVDLALAVAAPARASGGRR